MKKIVLFFVVNCFLSMSLFAQSDRQIWLNNLDQLANPVLSNLAEDKLKEKMPVELSNHIDNPAIRTKVAYLEAFARLLSGIAPWLNSETGDSAELAMRNKYRKLVIKGLSNAVNPKAKDYMNFTEGQSLVDASFLAYSFLRCPWLWKNMGSITRSQVVDALRLTRKIKPAFTNWLLFSGMIEAFFCKYDYDWDQMRIEFCVRQFEQWYVGDGVYADGVSYHWDYYNSYVIHPYLTAITDVVNAKNGAYKSISIKLKERSERYAIIQERLINVDGTYPTTGRSIVYRGAAFHHLADMAWRNKLPILLHPAQVRSALTAVIKKTMESSTTFKNGWLTIGVYGAQPELADFYNNTGSLYICANILLPLGLDTTDPFWLNPAEKWTAQKIWTGENVPGDHYLDK